MNIIIPMAGHSRRFKKAGYKDLKQFIKIDGKYMIDHVCDMFSPQDHFIFVCNKEHLDDNPKYREILKGLRQAYSICEIEPHEDGPVYSALQAKAHIKNFNEPIILSYCDFTVQWDYNQFLRKSAQYDASMAVFKGFHPASFGDTYYAYVRENEDMEMLELREKNSFTDKRWNEYASTGIYYVESWDIFEKYSRELLDKKDKVAAEYYCSLIYNYFVRDHLKVGLYEVDKFICWGTPEDLKEYDFWSDYFRNNVKFIKEKQI